MMEYARLNEARRSVNFFDPSVTITVEDIKAVYEQAKLAPSSFNVQPTKVVVALSPEIKEKLKQAAFGQPKVTEASAVLVLFGDTKQYLERETFQDWADRGYIKQEAVSPSMEMAKNLYEGEKEIGFVSRNVGIFAMNFMLAALDRGWDTHPMDGFDIGAVKELFGLDPRYLPVMLIAIGRKKPDVQLLPRAMRRAFEDVFTIK